MSTTWRVDDNSVVLSQQQGDSLVFSHQAAMSWDPDGQQFDLVPFDWEPFELTSSEVLSIQDAVLDVTPDGDTYRATEKFLEQNLDVDLSAHQRSWLFWLLGDRG